MRPTSDAAANPALHASISRYTASPRARRPHALRHVRRRGIHSNPARASLRGALVLARADRRAGPEPRYYLHSHRVVTQAERVWIVRETDASLTPDAPGDRCLICESASSVRSVWRYPRDWARLPDSELLKLFG